MPTATFNRTEVFSFKIAHSGLAFIKVKRFRLNDRAGEIGYLYDIIPKTVEVNGKKIIWTEDEEIQITRCRKSKNFNIINASHHVRFHVQITKI